MTVGAIILAAGRGTRMRGTSKLTADLHGKPVVAYAAEAVTDAGLPPPLVVLGDRATAVRAAVGDRPAQFVVAPDFDNGLSCSLRAGLAAAPAEWEAVLVMLGDMPRVSPATLQALAAVASRTAVAVPTWQGRRGNPVLWGRFHFPALVRLVGDTGGKALLSFLAVASVPADSDGILQDIDTPEALARFRGDPP